MSQTGADSDLERAARLAARAVPTRFGWVALVEGESVARWGSAGCQLAPIVRGENLMLTCEPMIAAAASRSPASLTLEVPLRQPSASPYHRAVPRDAGQANLTVVVCVGDWQPREWAADVDPLLEDVAALLTAGIARSYKQDKIRALEARLERAEQFKERLGSTLRHEFGQPLTVIQGFSELMAGEGLTPDEIREYAEEINREACRLAEIVARIRDLDALISPAADSPVGE